MEGERGENMMPYYHMGAWNESNFAPDGMLVRLWGVGCRNIALRWGDRVPMGRETRILIRAALGLSTYA